WAGGLIRRLDSRWPPPGALPVRVVHGDIRLGNVAVAADGRPAYLDFGFAARRPRVHELGYSLAWVLTGRSVFTTEGRIEQLGHVASNLRRARGLRGRTAQALFVFPAVAAPLGLLYWAIRVVASWLH